MESVAAQEPTSNFHLDSQQNKLPEQKMIFVPLSEYEPNQNIQDERKLSQQAQPLNLESATIQKLLSPPDTTISKFQKETLKAIKTSNRIAAITASLQYALSRYKFSCCLITSGLINTVIGVSIIAINNNNDSLKTSGLNIGGGGFIFVGALMIIPGLFPRCLQRLHCKKPEEDVSMTEQLQIIIDSALESPSTPISISKQADSEKSQHPESKSNPSSSYPRSALFNHSNKKNQHVHFQDDSSART